MRRGALYVVLCCMLLLASACTNVKSMKITEENKDKIWEQIKDTKDLTGEEVQLLQSYMLRKGLRSAFSGKRFSFPVGRTIGEIIEEERRYVQQEKAREEDDRVSRERARAAAEKHREVLYGALAVTLYEKGFYSGDFQDYVTLRLMYENRSGKDMRAFRGTLQFNDLFGEEVQKAELKEDKILKAGETRRVDRSLPYNRFIEADRKLRSTALENLKVVWLPTTILFTDGTSLQVDEE